MSKSVEVDDLQGNSAMDEVVFQLDEKDHLAIAVVGLLISILIWKWSASRFQSFVANEARLLLLACFTAGLPAIDSFGYMLFWVMLVSNPFSLWPVFSLLIIIWWLIYSILFYWIRWMYGNVLRQA